jgi:Helix-turn-helix domain
VARSASSSPHAERRSPRSRRAFPTTAGSGGVPGLRREEVALLAGISIEYYTRLERGDARGVSDPVLDALARALQLDDVERAHLVDLVRTANATRPARRRPTRQRVRPACSASSTR